MYIYVHISYITYISCTCRAMSHEIYSSSDGGGDAVADNCICLFSTMFKPHYFYLTFYISIQSVVVIGLLFLLYEQFRNMIYNMVSLTIQSVTIYSKCDYLYEV